MAAADAVGREVSAFDSAVFFQCFEGIGAAGGLKAAAMAHVRREGQAVGLNGQRQEFGKRGHGAGIPAGWSLVQDVAVCAVACETDQFVFSQGCPVGYVPSRGSDASAVPPEVSGPERYSVGLA